MGDGTTIRRSLPVQVGGLDGVVVHAAGNAHSLALKADGTVRAWGANNRGQLGDGTTDQRTSPVLISGLTGIVAVAAGSDHSLALKSNGTVWAWGANDHGQLGDGTTVQRATPTLVSGLGGVISVVAGAGHTLALKVDGTVWAWGLNSSGQLGDGSTTQRNSPVQVAGISGVASLGAGSMHSLALKSDGTAWAWGANDRGQLGNGGTTPSLAPVRISSISGVIAVAAGRNHGAALLGNGVVWVWGANESGQAGVGSLFDQTTPVQVPDLANVVALAAGFDHNLVVSMDGCVSGWGRNDAGQLGDQSVTERVSPIKVIGVSDVVSLAAGTNHTLARKSDGTMLAWGYNDFGQLGGGDSEGLRTVPAPVPTVGTAVSQAAGDRHTVIVKPDGTVWACGDNESGQLGDGTTVRKSTPVQVSNLTGISRVAVGDAHSMALASDGTVWSWGANASGQLGDGGTVQRTTPAQIAGLTDVTDIACGSSHSLALKSDGTVWAWGANADGGLGDGTTVQRNSPVQVIGLNTVIAFAAGGGHSVVLKEDGTVWIWGRNSDGQLGDGTTIAKLSPIAVSGLSEVVSLAAASNHTVALQMNGDLMTWGANASGQLGDGSRLRRLAPIQVAGKYGPFSSVAAGGDKTYMVKEDGTLFAWGIGAYGELANSFAAYRTEVVSALGFNRVHPVPSLTIASPPSPSDVVTGQNVSIELDASVANGQIASAYFYADGILLLEDQTAPFSFDYTPDTWGDVDVTAVVVSAAGAISAPASLSLRTPYDFDQDGFPDWWEIRNAMDPTVHDESTQAPPEPIPPTPGGIHSDADGMDDQWEKANGLDPNDASDGSLDFDRDGHTNFQEYGLGTDPNGAPYYRLREVGPLEGLSSALLHTSVLGDGMDTSGGTLESVYFMGSPIPTVGGGQRPVAWSVVHGAAAGTTTAYSSHGASSTSTCAQASSGAALTYTTTGTAKNFHFWRTPGTAPITMSGASESINVRGIDGGFLTAGGNYLVGHGYRASDPGHGGPVVWRMPVGSSTFSLRSLIPPSSTSPVYVGSKFYANDYGFVAATGWNAVQSVIVLWKVNETGPGFTVETILRHTTAAGSLSVAGISNEAEPLMVGRSGNGAFQEKAAAWRATATGADSVDLRIPGDVKFSAAAAVSPNGHVVAGTCRMVADTSTQYRVFTATWKPDSSSWRFQLHGQPVLGAEILSVNDFGEIFGKSTMAYGQAWNTTLWRHGKSHLLGDLIPAHTGHVLTSLASLNAQGTLLAKTRSGGVEMTVILTPDSDTDGDGLPDAFENQYGLNRLIANPTGGDTDADLLSDIEEFRNGTDPRNPDSDHDGMKDGWEISWGFLPLDPSDAQLDPDSDRVTNLRESEIGTTPTGIYRVETRYTEFGPSPATVFATGDAGDLILRGPYQYLTYTDQDGLDIWEDLREYWSLPADGTGPVSLPGDRDIWGFNEDWSDYLRLDQRVSYAPDNVLNPGIHGWVRRYREEENYAIQNECFLLWDIVADPSDESTWRPLSDVANALQQGPNPILQLGHTLDLDHTVASPSGRRRIHYAAGNHLSQFVLDQNGAYHHTLPGGNSWTHINDSGDAISQTFQSVPAANGQPAYQRQEILLSIDGNAPQTHPLPHDPTISGYFYIVSFSNDRKLLLSRTEPSEQLTYLTRYYIFDLSTGTLTHIRQPGLGNEAIASLSLSQGRLLGSGPKPFQITPDGTCIRLEALRIKNSPTDTPVPFGTLYPQTHTPNHIASNGRITLTTTNSANQQVILQITPHNDTDGDGFADDWEIAYDSPDGTGDQDDDGLNDAGELGNGTDLNNPDTDGDGIPDGEDLDPKNPVISAALATRQVLTPLNP